MSHLVIVPKKKKEKGSQRRGLDPKEKGKEKEKGRGFCFGFLLQHTHNTTHPHTR